MTLTDSCTVSGCTRVISLKGLQSVNAEFLLLVAGGRCSISSVASVSATVITSEESGHVQNADSPAAGSTSKRTKQPARRVAAKPCRRSLRMLVASLKQI